MARLEAIKAGDLMSEMTLTVKIVKTKQLAVRIAIGSFFLRVAALIMGCGIQIDTKPD